MMGTRKDAAGALHTSGVPAQPGLPLVVVPEVGIPDEKWTDDALCAQTDPDAFYPEKGGSTRDAKRVCLQCPVRMPCLEWALAHDERFGIWGGLSERERRRLKRGIL
jgi:WhiB family transcriptional regulator, redox-sensing transcriptional regulator